MAFACCCCCCRRRCRRCLHRLNIACTYKHDYIITQHKKRYIVHVIIYCLTQQMSVSSCRFASFLVSLLSLFSHWWGYMLVLWNSFSLSLSLSFGSVTWRLCCCCGTCSEWLQWLAEKVIFVANWSCIRAALCPLDSILQMSGQELQDDEEVVASSATVAHFILWTVLLNLA